MSVQREQVEYVIKTILDTTGADGSLTKFKQQLENIGNVDPKFKKQFDDQFTKVTGDADKFIQLWKNGLNDKSSVNKFLSQFETLQKDFSNLDKISTELKGSLDFSNIKGFKGTDFEQGINAVSDRLKELKKEINEIGASAKIDWDKLTGGNISPKKQTKFQTNMSEAKRAADQGNYAKALELINKELERQQGLYEKQGKAQVTSGQEAAGKGSFVTQRDNQKENIKITQEELEKVRQLTGAIEEQKQKEQELLALEERGANQIKEGIGASAEDINSANQAMQSYGEKMRQIANEQNNLNSSVDMFKRRIEYFFSAMGAVNLLRRAINSAKQQVIDLDKVMTETAVVTNFSVGDMWSQLPQYTERANQLGVSIHDVYEASTLYYQQGLKTNEVTQLTNATLKMARIAGLDAAEATDRMTNALRGFNMEINETNADRIADVYSKLAAMSASNVNEISTAMTKVASLASSANMQFETTAAFLSQIIETTRESAETAGTQLKTVVARFSEVKELVNQGELIGTDEEGEAIDVNKVSTALRTAGIDLNEYLTGVKGLDSIFVELASKWDSLDQVQQRYIATMAAGSRQQSRFIAMMQDYKRTTELIGIAQNATGASADQFNKTLESLESKMNQLKNAWDTFILGLADDQLIKGAVDVLRFLLDGLNKILSILPGISKSFGTLALSIGAFKVARVILQALFTSIKTGIPYTTVLTASWNKASLTSKLLQSNTMALNTQQDKYSVSLLKSTSIQGRYYELIGLGLPEERAEIAATWDAQAASELKQAAINEVSRALNLNEVQQKGYLNLTSQGIDKDLAYIMVTNEKIQAKYGEAIQSGKLSAEQKKEILLEARNIKLKQKGLIGYIQIASAKIGAGIQTLFGQKAETIDTLQTNQNTKQKIQNLQITLGLAAAIAQLIAVIVILIKKQSDNTPEKQLKKVKETLQKTTEAANQQKEQYDEIADSINQYEELKTDLDNLVIGTTEWQEKLEEVNNQVNELINTFPELAKYLEIDENGQLILNEDSLVEYKKDMQQKEAAAQQSEQIQQINSNTADFAEQIRQSKLGELTYGYTTESGDYGWDLIRNLTDDKLFKQYDILYSKLKENEKLSLGNPGGPGKVWQNTDIAKEESDVYQTVQQGFISEYENYLNENQKVINLAFQKSINDANANLFAIQTSKSDTDYQKEIAKTKKEYLDKWGIEKKDNQAISEVLDLLYEVEGIAINQVKDQDQSTMKKALEKYYGKDYYDSMKFEDMNQRELKNYFAGMAAELTQKNNFKDQFDEFNALDKKTQDLALQVFTDNIRTITLQEQEKVEELLLDEKEIDRISGSLGFKESDDYKKYVKDQIDVYKQYLSQVLWQLNDSYKKEVKNWAKQIEEKSNGKLSQSAQFGMMSTQNVLYQQGGNEAVDKYMELTNSILELPAATSKNYTPISNLLSQLGSLNTYSSIDAWLDAMEELGVDATSFKTEIQDITQQMRDFKQENILKNLGINNDLVKKLKDNEASYTAEEVARLKEIDSSFQDNFVQTSEDSFKLVGNNVQEMVNRILKDNEEMYNSKELQDRIDQGQKFSDKFGSKTVIDNDNGQEFSYQDLLSQIDNKELKVVDKATGENQISKTTIQQVISEITGEKIEDLMAMTSKQLETHLMNNSDVTAYLKLSNNLQQQKTLEGINQYYAQFEQGNYNFALTAENSEEATKALKAYAYENEITSEMVNMLGKQIGLTDKEIQNNEDLLYTAALQYQKEGEKIDTFKESLNNQKEELKSNQVTLKSWSKIVEKGKDLFGDSFDLTFAEQNQELLVKMLSDDQEIAQGAFDEISKLYQYSVAQMISNTDVNLLNDLYGVYQDTINDINSTTFSNITDLMKTLMEESSYTIDQIARAFSNMGFVIEYKVDSDGKLVYGTAKRNSVYGTGGVNKDQSTENEVNWDRAYNQLRKYDEEQRIRNKLESEYQRMLEEDVNASKLMDNIQAQAQTLTNQMAYLEQIKKIREQEKKELMKSNYYGKKGYFYFDSNNNLQIDREGLEQIKNDKDLYDKVDKILQEAQTWESNWEKNEDDIIDNLDKQNELLEKLRDSNSDLMNTIKDGMSQQLDEEIDSLSDINDSISDATSSLIDSIQKSIDKMRQDRENSESEKEISDLERKIAYLRMDTSGANQNEINKLQDQLNDKKQSYTDSLVDQAIQEMQDNADLAAEQREMQIKLLNEQKEQLEKAPDWDQIERIINEGIDSNGEVKPGSQLEEYWNKANDYQEKNQYEQDTIEEELKDAVAKWTIYDEWSKFGVGVDTTSLSGVTDKLSSIDTRLASYFNQKGEEDNSGVNPKSTGIEGNTRTISDIETDKITESSKIKDWGTVVAENRDKTQSSQGYKVLYDKYQSAKENVERGMKITELPTDMQSFFTTSRGYINDNVILENIPGGPKISDSDVTYKKSNKNLHDAALRQVLANALAVYITKSGGPSAYLDLLSDNVSDSTIERYIKELQKRLNLDQDGKVGQNTKKALQLHGYATGGLADYTGLAWLDGTPSKPELVLNQRDTENFIQLRDILSEVVRNGATPQNSGTAYLNIDLNIEGGISNDYDVDRLVERVEQKINDAARSRGVNIIGFSR